MDWKAFTYKTPSELGEEPCVLALPDTVPEASGKHPRYVQDVNNQPTEGVKQVGWLSCNDNPLSTDEAITCDVAHVGGVRVPDSEGFCCGCGLGEVVSGQPTRSSADCGLFSMSDSAHCLNFDGLWYSVYEVDRPQIFYDITISILLPTEYKLGGNVTYRESSLFLSHHQPVATAEGGALRAELVGDLAAAVAPHRFESKYLVVPQRPTGHARVNPSAPLENAMLLDRSLFDLSGRTCDRIGVSFPAFRYQAAEVRPPCGSCLHSQLEDFHSEDEDRLASGQPTSYRVLGYCDGSMELAHQSGTSGTQVFLACPLAQRPGKTAFQPTP
ncbi:HAP2 [Symbiodinium natans]|uniref:HAP2 protein n=1 Tax=Symbiodinium natans TaxID=878477 RepID=A0A812S201_9DINO|nr:HAP2 [Symbiodinium natans]